MDAHRHPDSSTSFQIGAKSRALIARLLSEEERRLYELAAEMMRRGLGDVEDRLRGEARAVGALAIEFSAEG